MGVRGSGESWGEGRGGFPLERWPWVAGGQTVRWAARVPSELRGWKPVVGGVGERGKGGH